MKPADSIDAFLAALGPEQRAALQALRKTIRAAAPKAEECISYGMPAFRLDGRILVYFSAAKAHCALYPGSAAAIEAHARELAGWPTSKGTIRFTPDAPLPAALVKRIVKYRIAENAAVAAKRRR